MKPLIKYTGGKYDEYEKIKSFFPSKINNYYEPFFGGGGVFFRLHENHKVYGKSYINDFSEDLVDFYLSVTDKQFENELNNLSSNWETLTEIADTVAKEYADVFYEVIMGKEDISNFINPELEQVISELTKSITLNIHGFDLNKRIIASLKDKTFRFTKKGISDDDTEVGYKSISTAICQAFYFIIRDMYNDWNNHGNKDKYSRSERSAQWFFIREMCFCSMSRFSSNGDFNVPYGGYSYNSKCLGCKIESILSKEAQNLFSNAVITQGDFSNVLDKKFEEGDFVFLDPPYDSTFTDYDGNEFGHKDHERLANILKNVNCKWLMAIGKTDFIYNLYKDFAYIKEYDKTYMYQARGTYDNKNTTHLLITNYEIVDVKELPLF